GLARGALDAGREAPRQPAVDHQRLDDVARDVGLAQDALDLRPPAAAAQHHERPHAGVAVAVHRDRAVAVATVAREERDPDEEAAALLEDRDGAALHCVSPASVCSARFSASSRFVLGLSTAWTSGWIPAPGLTPPPPRLCPSGVKYWPAVMSSAPPLSSSMTSWKTPLPNVRVPTTFARWWSWSAPVTISDADAVSRSTSTTSGVFGATVSPVAFSVSGATPRPRSETILPSLRNA